MKPRANPKNGAGQEICPRCKRPYDKPKPVEPLPEMTDEQREKAREFCANLAADLSKKKGMG